MLHLATEYLLLFAELTTVELTDSEELLFYMKILVRLSVKRKKKKK